LLAGKEQRAEHDLSKSLFDVILDNLRSSVAISELETNPVSSGNLRTSSTLYESIVISKAGHWSKCPKD
jgi:hypothetical protein